MVAETTIFTITSRCTRTTEKVCMEVVFSLLIGARLLVSSEVHLTSFSTIHLSLIRERLTVEIHSCNLTCSDYIGARRRDKRGKLGPKRARIHT